MQISGNVYVRLQHRLRELVITGEAKPGERFLTERELSRRFGVSRPTANKILHGLVAEGLLEIRKGVGTFVRQGALELDLRNLVSFTEKASQFGYHPTTQVLSLERLQAEALPPGIGRALALGQAEMVWSMRRLRIADKTPVILEDRWLRTKFLPELTRATLEGSLYLLLTEVAGVPIVGADQTLVAIDLPEEESGILGVAPGSAALCIEGIGLTTDEVPLWYEKTRYRGDSYVFHHRLGPVRHQPPVGRVVRSKLGEQL